MKFSTSLLASGLLSLACAQPLNHEHHAHAKRDIVTVVVTEVVTHGANVADAVQTSAAVSSEASSGYNGYSSTLNTIILSSSGSSVSTISDAGSYTSATSTSTSTSSGSASGSSSSSSSSSSSTGSIGFASGAKGITYSPYTSTGSCKDASTVKSDIAKLSQFDIIRIYDTDCSGVENVLAALSSNQKLFAGIYYLEKIADSVKIISNAVNGDWSNIYTVSVGNELVQDGTATSDIKSAVDEARTALTSAGYSGTVVSVDTLVAVQDNPELCDYSDFVAVNSHPFWDGNVSPEDAGTFLKTQIANIQKICGGKDVLITETGWPTQGDSYGSCVPSLANQKTAVSAIASEVGDDVLLFTTYNDYWKSGGDYGVEQYWGILQDDQ
jgi:exo-beta-1,3-glucanase (GH17 family)